MTPLHAALLVVVTTLGGWGVLSAWLWRRREAVGEKRAGQAPAAQPHIEAARGVTRRQFLNRAYLTAIVVGLSNVALASLDFLWPRGASGAGTKILVGDAEVLRAQLEQTRTPIFNPEGFFC